MLGCWAAGPPAAGPPGRRAAGPTGRLAAGPPGYWAAGPPGRGLGLGVSTLKDGLPCFRAFLFYVLLPPPPLRLLTFLLRLQRQLLVDQERLHLELPLPLAPPSHQKTPLPGPLPCPLGPGDPVWGEEYLGCLEYTGYIVCEPFTVIHGLLREKTEVLILSQERS